MLQQTQNAIRHYRQRLENALQKAPSRIRNEAIQDADEFLSSEVHAMDVGRLTNEDAALAWFVQRLGTPEQLAAEYLETTGRVVNKPRCRFRLIAACAALLIGIFAFPVFNVQGETRKNFAKLSPFTKVVFENDNVIVDYDSKTWQLVSIDGITADKIVASAKEQFSSRWQKRIAEDLVEVFDGMGHKVGKSVKLVLKDRKTDDTRAVEDAPMTIENRQRVYHFRNKDLLVKMTGELPKAPKTFVKVSPFTKVVFENSNVVVDYDGKTWQLLSIDEITADKIVASAKEQFGSRWQKRIAEDLVEVFDGMGHQVEKSVKLVLKDRKTDDTRAVEEAPMTHENRKMIWRFRNKD